MITRFLLLLFSVTLACGSEPTPAAPPEFLVQSRPVRAEPFRATPIHFNPPTFRWPVERNAAAAYRIELSRDAGFAQVQAEVVSDLWYRPQQPLAPGTWYWRYRIETPQPEPWLGSESFEISSALPGWPLPAWTELVARIPAVHPRVYTTRAEIEALRANARRLSAKLAPFEEKIRRELRMPFSLAPYQARVPAGADPQDPDAASQARKKLIWESKFAALDGSAPMAGGAWLWLTNGDPELRELVKARARQLAALDSAGFITERNTGADGANIDFGNAVLVHELGVVYDLMHGEFTEEERAQIRRAIAARAAPIFGKVRRVSQQLMRAHAWQHGFLDAMVGALAIHGEEPAASGWVESGLKAFVAFYPWFGGADGGSQEGTRYYHGPELLATLNTLDVFRAAFGLRLEDGNPWFRANPYFLIYSFPPGGTMARLGDSNSGQDDETDDLTEPAGKARLVANRMAELYGNGHAAAYAAALPEDGAGFSVSEILRWGAPTSTRPVPLETLPAARLFGDIGAVYTHSAIARAADNVRLVFHSSPYGGHGHSHADQNSFHISAYNEDLLLDSGYYTPTGDPHRQQWSVQTKAHNTLLIDGKGQRWGDTTGYGGISHFETHEGWTYFRGSAATAYRETPLDRFDRHVVWLRGGSVETYVIVDDVVASGGTTRRFDWLLHAAQQMEIDAPARRVTARGAKSEAVISFLAPSSLAFGQDDQFDAPAVYWRYGKNIPLPNQWHLKATPPQAAAARFLTVIQVSRPGVAKPSVRGIESGVETAGWQVRVPESGLRASVQRVP